MDYSKYNREQLIDIIEELQMVNKELLNEKIQAENLDFAWTSSLGHWYLNLKTKLVVFNPLKIQAMGYSMEEIPERITYNFFTDKLHPDDYQETMNAMINHMKGTANMYECEYRIQTKDGAYRWFYDRGKITQRDASGKPVLVSGIVFDITDRKEKELNLIYRNEILEKESTTDALTRLLNRRAIMKELEKRANQAIVNHSPLSIAIFDIDYFKRINDDYGHPYGDMVLKKVASTITQSLRKIDSVGRYGGEEFLVVLPKTDKAKAIIIAERIREAVKQLDFNKQEGVTISGGVSDFNGETIVELIKKADKKLYEAKKNGRNRIKG